MIQWLLFDGVDAVAARTPVRRQDDLIVFAGANKAKPALAFVQFAEAGADVALNSPVVERMPVFRRDRRRGAGSHDLPLCCPNQYDNDRSSRLRPEMVGLDFAVGVYNRWSTTHDDNRPKSGRCRSILPG